MPLSISARSTSRLARCRAKSSAIGENETYTKCFTPAEAAASINCNWPRRSTPSMVSPGCRESTEEAVDRTAVAPAQAAWIDAGSFRSPVASSAPAARSSSIRDASPVGRTSARTGFCWAASRRQISPLAAPFELACHTGGQRYTGFQFTVIERQSHGNFALGMRDRAGYVRQLAQEWADRDAREAGCRVIDAQHRAEEFVIRAGAPGVAIRARGIGCFGPSGQSAVEHGAPRAQHVEVSVAHARFIHGGVQVVAKVNRALHQAPVAGDALDQVTGFGALAYTGQHRQRVGLLRVFALVRRVGE